MIPSNQITLIKIARILAFFLLAGSYCSNGYTQIASPIKDTTICFGESVTLISEPAYLYEWDNGETSQSFTRTPSVTTTYNLTSYNPNISSDLVTGGNFDTNSGGVFRAIGELNISDIIWSQNVSVSANTKYIFRIDAGCDDFTNLDTYKFDLIVNGQIVEDIEFQSGPTCSGLNEYYGIWDSGSTSGTITISITNNFLVGAGDDFILDNIQFMKLIPSVGSRKVYVVNLNVELGPDQTICEGESVNLSAGYSGLNYLWSPNNETTENISVTTSGTYSVLVSDNNGCSASDEIEITVNPKPNVTEYQFIQMCEGETKTLDAGVSGFNYLWSRTSETTQKIDITAVYTGMPDVYPVEVTNPSTSCASTSLVIVTVHQNPVVDLGSDRAMCSGSMLSTGSADSHYWSNEATTQSIPVTTSGLYSVEITDSHGCKTYDEVNITVNPLPEVNLGNDLEFCSGEIQTLNAKNPGATYSWSGGATSRTLDVSASGNYSVDVTDANGCTASDEVEVTVYSYPVVNLGGNQTICEGETVTLDAENPGSTYLWSNSDETQKIDVSIAGTYEVTVTGPGGCSSIDNMELTTLPVPVIELGPDQKICEGSSIELDAKNPGASYSWSNNASTQKIIASISGNYTVIITHPNGCSVSDAMNLTVHPNPVLTLTNQAICDGETLTLDAENPGSTYSWSNGDKTQKINVSTQGTYQVTVTSAEGCSINDNMELTVNTNPVVNLGPDTDFCEGNSLELDAQNNGSTYLWNDGDESQKRIITETGEYEVTVTNGDGCSSSDKMNLTVHANPTPTLSNQAICDGETLILDAENHGSTYLWSNGDKTQKIKVSTQGTYSVDITSDEGCTITDNMELTVNANPVVDLGPDNEFCEGNSVELDAENPGSTYLWNDGDKNRKRIITETGEYEVTVTNGNGCSSSDKMNLTVHANPTLPLTNQSICDGETITLDAENPGSTYSWSNGDKIQKIDVSTPGTYSVDITNDEGCTITDNMELSVHANPVVDLGPDIEFCEGNSVELDAQNNGATYLWSNKSTSQKINISKAGEYEVTVTNKEGCSSSDKLSATTLASPIVDLGDDIEICEGNSTELDAGNPNASYIWNNGSTTKTINISESAEYEVTVINKDGCTNSDKMILTVHANPIPTLSDQVMCDGETITLDARNYGASYFWINGATTQTLDVATPGTYQVDITNKEGCSITDKMELTILPRPLVDLGSDKEICEGSSIELNAGNTGIIYDWNNGEKSQIIDITTAGEYEVTVTNSDGCIASDKMILTVHPNPIPYLSDLAICDGETITLDAKNYGASYLWNNGAKTRTIDASKSGTYQVDITNEKGCSITDKMELTILPSPIVELGSDLEICEGNFVELNAGNKGASYYWNNGAKSQILSITETGEYEVTVTNSDGCSASDQINLTVHPNPIPCLADQAICEGETITLDAGNIGSSYIWINGETSKSIEVSIPNTYEVKITNPNGCSIVDKMLLTNPSKTYF